jgi:aspartokinase-like uncharacterized kinase
MRTVIFKVGGSLFDLRDLGPRLHELIWSHGADPSLIFPGGGAAANLVRDWHPRFELTDVDAHWLAIDALDFNANLLARLLPRGIVVSSQSRWEGMMKSYRPTVLAPSRFLRDEGRSHASDSPPHVWDVTSDTLAAWTAVRWPADELVLVKSVPCPVGKTAVEAVQAGLVDAYFPGYAGRLPRVNWCCLRDAEPRVTPWLDHGRPVMEA